MEFRKYTPSYPISQYVEYLIYAKGAQSLPYLMELPDGRINLVLEMVDTTTNSLFNEHNFEGKHSMRHGWISGANAKAIVYECNNNSAIISIRFTLGGFFALTKIPISEIIHPGLELELLLGVSFKKLYEQVINEPNIENKFQLILCYFENYIQDNSFETSIAKFIDKNIDKPIDWLVNKSGYSQKHLIHILKNQTGFSPKYLQRLQRFHNVINSIQINNDKINWASLANEFGYFDQAHFIKEFIHFTGFSPLEYFNTTITSEHNKIFKDTCFFRVFG